MNDNERAAWENMKSWREVRDSTPPGSADFERAEQEFKKAEVEYFKARD